jgi:hypothetical protein
MGFEPEQFCTFCLLRFFMIKLHLVVREVRIPRLSGQAAFSHSEIIDPDVSVGDIQQERRLRSSVADKMGTFLL